MWPESVVCLCLVYVFGIDLDVSWGILGGYEISPTWMIRLNVWGGFQWPQFKSIRRTSKVCDVCSYCFTVRSQIQHHIDEIPCWEIGPQPRNKNQTFPSLWLRPCQSEPNQSCIFCYIHLCVGPSSIPTFKPFPSKQPPGNMLPSLPAQLLKAPVPPAAICRSNWLPCTSQPVSCFSRLPRAGPKRKDRPKRGGFLQETVSLVYDPYLFWG